MELNVGIRLRSLREQRGLSLRGLSELCGLSTTAIHMIERGENSPTVSSLHRLAESLHVPITTFFQEDPKQTTILVKQDQGLRSQKNGVVMESLGIGLFNQQMEPFLITVQPGARNGHEPITHSGEEFIHCLEGKLVYSIGDKVYALEKGDSLLFDATQNHAYYNPTDKPATFLLVYKVYEDHPQVQQLHLEA